MELAFRLLASHDFGNVVGSLMNPWVPLSHRKKSSDVRRKKRDSKQKKKRAPFANNKWPFRIKPTANQ